MTGNKGAELMLLSIIKNMETLLGACDFDLVSVYSKQDRQVPLPPRLNVVSGSPLFLMGLVLPLSLVLSPFIRFKGVRAMIRKIPLMRTLLAADMVLDCGGVSFIENRGLPLLIYNLSLCLPPVLLGRPFMKLSQAMGPFTTTLNRVFAKLGLTGADWIVARGAITGEHLKTLGLKKFSVLPDVAFALKGDERSFEEAKKILAELNLSGPSVGILPSVVVEDYAEIKNIDYLAVMQELISHLMKAGYTVLLLPHSVRTNSQERMNNDLLLCRELKAMFPADAALKVIERDLSALVLRQIIARMDFIIASRFHAMVSSLSEKVPLLLIGWSHKYMEVMRMFELEDWAVDFSRIESQVLVSRFEELVKEKTQVKYLIEKNLPRVQEEARKNFEIAANILREPSREVKPL